MTRTNSKARELSEGKFKLMVENAREGIIFLDIWGNILEANPSVLKISGAKREEVVGKNFTQLLRGMKMDLPSAAASFKDVIRGRLPSRLEWTLVNKKGEKITIFIHYSLIRKNGRAVGVSVEVEDITERRQMEANLIQSEKMAAVGQLGAGVAHEINNPLGAILGFTQMLLSSVSEGDQRHKDLKKIESAALRCKKTVASLLNFSQPAETKFERIDINQIIEEALFLFKQEIKIQGNIKIIKNFHEVPPPLSGNANQLQQVFLNILTNAKNALSDGGNIRVSTIVNREEKNIEIRFADNGRGISQKDLPKIFEPFFSLKRTPESFGLGLAICRQIMEKHKGKIEVESKLNKGTTFTVKLPV